MLLASSYLIFNTLGYQLYKLRVLWSSVFKQKHKLTAATGMDRKIHRQVNPIKGVTLIIPLPLLLSLSFNCSERDGEFCSSHAWWISSEEVVIPLSLMFADLSVCCKEQNRGEVKGIQRVEADIAITLSLALLWSVVTELMEIMTANGDPPRSWKETVREKQLCGVLSVIASCFTVQQVALIKYISFVHDE